VKDRRLSEWEPRFDSSAGTDRLDPYPVPGGVGYNYPGAGKALGQQVYAGGRGGEGGRDLVKELEVAFERLKGWKEPGWIESLIDA
jgi:hypothetical protein